VIELKPPRDKLGRFIAYKPGEKRYTEADIKSAFIAGLNNQQSFILPSKKFEIYTKKNNIF
jgi:hypothetical protein